MFLSRGSERCRRKTSERGSVGARTLKQEKAQHIWGTTWRLGLREQRGAWERELGEGMGPLRVGPCELQWGCQILFSAKSECWRVWSKLEILFNLHFNKITLALGWGGS